MEPILDKLQDQGLPDRYWKWKKNKHIPHSSPYIFIYKKNQYSLCYIATNHNNSINKYIDVAFKKFIKIDIILVEGIPFDIGINMNVNNIGGEIDYIINLAKKNGVPYIGGEPSDKILYKELLKTNKLIHKITKKDIMLFECLRQYKALYNDGADENSFKRDIEDNVLPYLKKMLNLTSKHSLSYNKYFLTYYKKLFLADFIYGEVDLEIASPNKYGCHINKVSYILSIIRDKFIMINLYTLYKKYNNILMIYGQNHYYTHMKVLENTFGKPSYIEI